MDERLEQITTHQTNIINDLHCYVMDQCLGKPRAESDFDTVYRRKRQGDEYLSTIGVKTEDGWPIITVEKAAKFWHAEELQWSKEDWTDRLPAAWLYRILLAFSRNHLNSPFTKENKSFLGGVSIVDDSTEFNNINSHIFNDFCKEMVRPEDRFKEPELCALRAHLGYLTSHNINKAISSARHKLMGKDFAILKGVLIGGGIGVLSSLFFGPVIGGYIGNAVGLSGAAATSYGLALLGGGSIASGGFGMFGGSIMLGVAFGAVKGTYNGMAAADIDMLGLHIACRNLPILLATGRKLKELGYNIIPRDIRRVIHRRLQENNERLATLDPDSKDYESRKSMIKATANLYESAFEMAEHYNWICIFG